MGSASITPDSFPWSSDFDAIKWIQVHPIAAFSPQKPGEWTDPVLLIINLYPRAISKSNNADQKENDPYIYFQCEYSEYQKYSANQYPESGNRLFIYDVFM